MACHTAHWSRRWRAMASSLAFVPAALGTDGLPPPRRWWMAFSSPAIRRRTLRPISATARLRKRRVSAVLPWLPHLPSSSSWAAHRKTPLRTHARCIHITMGIHSSFTLPSLNFSGSPAGIDTQKSGGYGHPSDHQHRYRTQRCRCWTGRRRDNPCPARLFCSGTPRACYTRITHFSVWLVSRSFRRFPTYLFPCAISAKVVKWQVLEKEELV